MNQFEDPAYVEKLVYELGPRRARELMELDRDANDPTRRWAEHMGHADALEVRS